MRGSGEQIDAYWHRCWSCSHEEPFSLLPESCARCGELWWDVVYDTGPMSRGPSCLGIDQRDTTMWRYRSVLPLPADSEIQSRHEGWTPLYEIENWSRRDEDRIWVKDERRNPTGSFKDRQASMTFTWLVNQGIEKVVVCSTGNVAVAYASYAALSGTRLRVFVPEGVSDAKKREAEKFGAEVVELGVPYDEAKVLAADWAETEGWVYDSGARMSVNRESKKTLALEIAEQLGWRAPDWYVQGTSGGMGPIGVWKGFDELARLGITNRVPRLGIVQPTGCAPMVRAFEAGLDTAPAVLVETDVQCLRTGDPGRGYGVLRSYILRTGGAFVSVDDERTHEMGRALAREQGMLVDPAAAAAFAGVESMREQGIIGEGELVVVNCSGAGPR